MVCENCDPKLNRPGKLIEVTEDLNHCASCGDKITYDQIKGQDLTIRVADQHMHSDMLKLWPRGTTPFSKMLEEQAESIKRWDIYFHTICEAVASKSPCLSRQIGALLVRDNSIVSTGYNGPPRGVPHCGHERFIKDKQLNLLAQFSTFPDEKHILRFEKECPRKVLGYESGTHMELCPAQHAEQNCVSNAARLGVGVRGTMLYMNSVVPCKNCFGTLINAGIVEIVVDKVEVYDKHTQFLIDDSSIVIRPFNN